jgi:hypothetical protein
MTVYPCWLYSVPNFIKYLIIGLKCYIFTYFISSCVTTVLMQVTDNSIHAFISLDRRNKQCFI